VKIHLMIFLSSIKEQHSNSKVLMKSFESSFRPIEGDIIDDPGFHPAFHNGYEVVKVTINYSSNECFVSLHPLVLDREEISVEDYINRLKKHDWQVVSQEEIRNM